ARDCFRRGKKCDGCVMCGCWPRLGPGAGKAALSENILRCCRNGEGRISPSLVRSLFRLVAADVASFPARSGFPSFPFPVTRENVVGQIRTFELRNSARFVQTARFAFPPLNAHLS